MQVRDVMNRNVGLVTPDTLLREAARRMSALRSPILLVCDNQRVVGLVTPRDLIVRATAQGCDPHTSTVREVMTREIVCGQESQDVAEAAAIMRRHRLSRMPVVDRHHRPTGIVSLAELSGQGWPWHGSTNRMRKRKEVWGEN